jgi:hypothetical protein
MHHSKIDALARSLATRRLALGGGAALLLGAAFADDAEGKKCRRIGAKCGKKRCCGGARCKRGRCRCKANSPLWAGKCCKHRFALADGMGLAPIPGTEFCCKGRNICRKDGDPAHDDCCQKDETCIDGKCCCDGCRGTVVCGGVCCGSDSCCNGQCCPSGQICAQTENGPTCVSGQQPCADGCYPGETCWDEVCCTPDRMCTVVEGNDLVQKCCSVNEYCDQALGTCCSNGNICTTGKKVRIRV